MPAARDLPSRLVHAFTQGPSWGSNSANPAPTPALGCPRRTSAILAHPDARQVGSAPPPPPRPPLPSPRHPQAPAAPTAPLPEQSCCLAAPRVPIRPSTPSMADAAHPRPPLPRPTAAHASAPGPPATPRPAAPRPALSTPPPPPPPRPSCPLPAPHPTPPSCPVPRRSARRLGPTCRATAHSPRSTPRSGTHPAVCWPHRPPCLRSPTAPGASPGRWRHPAPRPHLLVPSDPFAPWHRHSWERNGSPRRGSPAKHVIGLANG